jgi:hypothetical protein
MNSNKTESGRFLRITEIYAFVSKDKEGNEGIMGATFNIGQMMPLIGADIERVESLIPIADKIKEITGMDYEIRYFVVKKKK